MGGFAEARAALRAGRRVTLHGRPPTDARAMVWAMGVVIAVLVVIAVGPAVTYLNERAQGRDVWVVTAVWTLPVAVPALIGVALYLRRHLAWLRALRGPVVLEPAGWTAAGVGPIPWHHFHPPARETVADEYADHWHTETTLTPTPEGRRALSALPPSRRRRLTRGGSVLTLGGQPEYVPVPRVAELTTPEMARLMTEAGARFARGG